LTGSTKQFQSFCYPTDEKYKKIGQKIQTFLIDTFIGKEYFEIWLQRKKNVFTEDEINGFLKFREEYKKSFKDLTYKIRFKELEIKCSSIT